MKKNLNSFLFWTICCDNVIWLVVVGSRSDGLNLLTTDKRSTCTGPSLQTPAHNISLTSNQRN